MGADIQVTGSDALDLIMTLAHQLEFVSRAEGELLILSQRVEPDEPFISILAGLIFDGILRAKQAEIVAEVCYEYAGGNLLDSISAA